MNPDYQEWLQFKMDTDPEFRKWKQQKDAEAARIRAEQELEAERKRVAILAVDLGLSVKWAKANLGTEAPGGFGDYYAWGEVYQCSDRYKWSKNGSLTKYITRSNFGTVDNKTVLDPEDDAAHVKLGGKWRIPTDDEWTELRNKCTWTWIANGYKVTSKINGNSIFLPAAGHRYGASSYGAGSHGSYCSSSLNAGSPNGAWSVCFDSEGVSRYETGRIYGLSVRPVTE